jgi:hypothetical protein
MIDNTFIGSSFTTNSNSLTYYNIRNDDIAAVDEDIKHISDIKKKKRKKKNQIDTDRFDILDL